MTNATAMEINAVRPLVQQAMNELGTFKRTRDMTQNLFPPLVNSQLPPNQTASSRLRELAAAKKEMEPSSQPSPLL